MKAPLLTDCPNHCGAQITPKLAKQINDPEDFDAFCPTDVNARALARQLSDRYNEDLVVLHEMELRQINPTYS